jgi:hypothetical protein
MFHILATPAALIQSLGNNLTLDVNVIPSTDVNLIFVTLLLGFCALLAPFITKYAEHHMYAPKLEFSFELDQPYCHKTVYTGGEPVYYFRLQIENTGGSQARKCEVVLEKIWTIENETPTEVHNFTQVNLIWSGLRDKEIQYIDINPRRRIFCDIGHITSAEMMRYTGGNNNLLFVLELLHMFNAYSNQLRPGKHILEIGLYSENATYQKINLEISWSGVWKDSANEMFREINIKQIGDDSYSGYTLQ